MMRSSATSGRSAGCQKRVLNTTKAASTAHSPVLPLVTDGADYCGEYNGYNK